MKISIIIPVYAKTDKGFVKLCLESIHKYSKEKHEIIVCVNPALNIEGYEDLPATYVIASDIQGQWHANNVMVRKASNEWIMLIDDDTVLPSNWEEIFEHLESDVVSMNCMEPDRFGRGYAPPFVKCDCGTTPDTFDWVKFEKMALELREEKMESGNSYPFFFKNLFGKRLADGMNDMIHGVQMAIRTGSTSVCLLVLSLYVGVECLRIILVRSQEHLRFLRLMIIWHVIAVCLKKNGELYE